MGKSDFEARLKRLGQDPSNSYSAAHQAMLTHEIASQRTKRAAPAPELGEHEDGGILPASMWLSLLLGVSGALLGLLYSQNPEQAVKAAFVMGPIMLLIAFVLLYRTFKNDKLGAVFDFFEDGLPLVRTLIGYLR